MKYHGRGIMLGTSEKGECIAAYFIMGRSENSRNRVLEIKGDELFTAPADESKVKDPSLIIYKAITDIETASAHHLIISNGDHTNTIADFIRSGGDFKSALMTRREEPDEPNFTPRISGIADFMNGDFSYKLSILKRDESESDKCRREFFAPMKRNGKAHFIHTYAADGEPLPSFEGEPKEISIPSDIDEFANLLWESLDKDNRISLYVRFTNPKTMSRAYRLINKYRKAK